MLKHHWFRLFLCERQTPDLAVAAAACRRILGRGKGGQDFKLLRVGGPRKAFDCRPVLHVGERDAAPFNRATMARRSLPASSQATCNQPTGEAAQEAEARQRRLLNMAS